MRRYLDTTLAYLRHLACFCFGLFSFGSGSFVHLFITQIRCRNRSPDERCEEEMEDSEKQQRTSIVYNNTEGSLGVIQRKAKTRRRNFQEE